MSATPWRLSKWIEKCRSYGKVCVKYNFNISAFVGFIVWIVQEVSLLNIAIYVPCAQIGMVKWYSAIVEEVTRRREIRKGIEGAVTDETMEESYEHCFLSGAFA